MNGNTLHRHGGNPAYEFKRLGIPPRPVIDFSVNINPLGPPPVVRLIWEELFKEVEHYPSVDGQGIRSFYRERFQLDPHTVFPGNGASDALYHLFRLTAPKTVVIFQPSYHDYSRAAGLSGASIRTVPLSHSHDFSYPDPAIVAVALKNADAIIIGHPNNPTGVHMDRDGILFLARQYPDTCIIVDESFIQFLPDVPDHSFLFLTERPPNIFIIHSLTKFYGLPGLRLGSCVAAQDWIERLERFAPPWRVNGIADTIAQKLSFCGDYEYATVQLIEYERTRLQREMAINKMFRLFSSKTNFVLAQWAGNNLDDLLKMLLNQGIFIRDCRNFPGLEDNFFRFAVLDSEKNDAFLKALSKCDVICGKVW